MSGLKVRAAWRKNLLRQLRGGRSYTEACNLLSVGKAKVNQECRRDPAFKAELEGVLGRPVDAGAP